jgi:hypothetical protein
LTTIVTHITPREGRETAWVAPKKRGKQVKCQILAFGHFLEHSTPKPMPVITLWRDSGATPLAIYWSNFVLQSDGNQIDRQPVAIRFKK